MGSGEGKGQEHDGEAKPEAAKQKKVRKIIFQEQKFFDRRERECRKLNSSFRENKFKGKVKINYLQLKTNVA